MILVIDMCETKESLHSLEFVRPITDILKTDFTVKHFTEITDEDLNKCDKVILSGSPLNETSYADKIKLFDWIKDLDKPLLGICGGFQTICMIFGKQLKTCQEIGLTKITKQDDPLLNAMKSDEVYELHNFACDCPEEFRVIAESDKCIQAIKHKQKPIYATLFHPEVRNKELIAAFHNS